MYISLDEIKNSLKKLEPFHPFFGNTFLVSKKGTLPIGRKIEFPFDTEEKRFLEQYYKPAKNSKYYYRVFKPSDKEKTWLDAKYASSGSQSTRTRGPLSFVFLHETNTNLWGWEQNYIKKLKEKLGKKLIPVFHLAIWLYHEREWSSNSTAKSIIETFLDEFHIIEEEKRELFDLTIPANLTQENLFQEEIVTWKELQQIIGSPPDAIAEEGGTLTLLELEGVGPARKISFEPADRISLITGDNGLGKTFLLECCWWALTGEWADKWPAYPRLDAKEAKISFKISGETQTSSETIKYNLDTQSWPSPKGRPTIPGLVVYARVDGSFAVWDPARNTNVVEHSKTFSGSFVFSREEIWDGSENKIEGLLRDWVTWQDNPETSPFSTFVEVLKRLSPPEPSSDLGTLEPGESVRLPTPPYPARRIPTIKHTYGQIPILHAAAGVKRILTLAYLLVWAWEEHKIQSKFNRRSPQKRLVILIDEIEAHLHPKWQRTILPALLGVSNELSSDIQVQILVATHSPLVMASIEPEFDEDKDKLFHLDITQADLFGTEVKIEELDFIRYGPINSWLVSEVFELRHARSVEAENTIEEAKALQLKVDPQKEDVQIISGKLQNYLSAQDEFWPRWTYFAKKHGVEM